MKLDSKNLLALVLGFLFVAAFQSASAQFTLPPSIDEATGQEAVTATPTPAPTFGMDPQKRELDEKSFRSLEGTYDYELHLMDDEKYAIDYELADIERREYELWTRVKSFTQTPNVSLHGLGRAVGISQQYYGDYSNFKFNFPSDRFEKIFLDFEPIVVISREIRMSGIFRWTSSILPVVGSDLFYTRRLRMDLQPEFLTALIGDFEESYTPFMLWNRNNLDLYYKPEMMARADEYAKFEDFYNHEPAWPFRGLRLETALGWPNSDLLELWKISVFAHMIQNGASTTAYLANWTDWIFAGHMELKSKRWYTGFTSWQTFLDAYGIILDEPADSNPKSTAAYKSNTSTTWLHQYRLWSVRPMMRVGLGDDVYLGVQGEPAFSAFQDDKFSTTRTFSDKALRGGPFLQMGSSKIEFNYLNVGPQFYSPLAQTRQDFVKPVTLSSSVTMPAFGGVPDLFQAPLRGFSQSSVTVTAGTIFFLPNVPRAGDIFGYYDRTVDNTFPYGLGTPNRQGVGMDMDIKAMKNYALKIKGAAYFVNEISANLVDSGGLTVAGAPMSVVDTTAAVTQNGVTLLPAGAELKRNFTYINFGPSFDFGPSVGLPTPLEIGANVRYEQTNSALGTLTSTWLLAGLRVGFFPGVEATVAYSELDFNGWEEGINPDPSKYSTTPLARYSYVGDPRDLGSASSKQVYRAFQVNGNTKSLMASMTLEVSRNSRFYLDYDLTQGTEIVNVGAVKGTLYNQYIGGVYDIKF